MDGSAHIQVFLDTQFKAYTRILVQDEVTTGEIIKNFKSKYTNQSPQQVSNLGGVSGSMLQSSGKFDKSSLISGTSGATDIRKTDIISGSQGGQGLNYSHDYMQQNSKEYGLFLINTKPQNPLLAVRKLQTYDYALRIYKKTLDNFKKDGEERFKLCFAKCGDIEDYIKEKCGSSIQSLLDEEKHVVSQLGKSIINNKTYERKGKLYKKSQNSDKFKERQFVLDKDQLFYYKNEKQKDKNINLIMLSNASIILTNYPKQKYCFEIENDNTNQQIMYNNSEILSTTRNQYNRKYILSTKSQYDLNQWVYAIQGQIRLSRDNRNIADVSQSIMLREKEIASNDMLLIQNIFKPKNVIFNPVQPILLDFINDPFINELLPNLTKYITLVREKDYQRHAFDKAKDIIQQLKILQKKLQQSLTNLQSSKSKIEEEIKSSEINITNPSQDVQLLMLLSEQQLAQSSLTDDYKRYKDLQPEQKIQQIFHEEDLNSIELEYSKLINENLDPNQLSFSMNPRLFNNILMKINRIIKYNYLEDFFKERKIELLSIPIQNFKMSMTPMDFNCIGQGINCQGTKNINIIEKILLKKIEFTQQSNHLKFQTQTSGLDPNFQNQIKQFIGNINQEQRSTQFSDEKVTSIIKIQNQ